MAERRVRILIGAGTCGIAAGAGAVWAAAELALESLGLTDVPVVGVGCIGYCQEEPLLDVEIDGRRFTYKRVKGDQVKRILEKHLLGGEPVTQYLLGECVDGPNPYPHLPFYAGQNRVATRNCGFIDPSSLTDYEARGGYAALRKALALGPDQIIETMKTAGLRGRGGAGFPTGRKWELAAKSPGPHKFMICNADEGDPGAFMDRSILEGDPHAVIEGMAIGAYAIGADEGYIYCRAEYPLALERLRGAIAQAEAAGYLGDNILGTGFGFHLHLKEGAGAFVCGEETALMASIEGRRGMPRPRPPYPAQSGLFARPSNINNVETFANVPAIIRNGGDWYAAMGTEGSKGTKVFALTGQVNRTGLAEVPMGVTIREVVYEIGGGIPNDRELKAVQIGGPSGGCLPARLLDLPIDYESLQREGAIMGSGGMVVVDETTCMVDFARFFMAFCARESCGKCSPCREGTTRMLEILTRICDGHGSMADLERLERLARNVRVTSLCGLGQSAPNPVLSSLTHFRAEFEAHILDKRCPAGVCKNLISYAIDREKCTGCVLCARNCPVDAISGEKRQPHTIDPEICIKCGACFDVCKFDAVLRG
ncbi:MAG TPA: NADH-ubiquinone oxidoreductase-F iron-sulfur binding region domain-containing protein [Symbiobacteriaceae bacterium]|nr:NADH-ubiquinone oxidoreductase-F iron-sulfur binding region domain-containing protein [Symbiobacteriaceae bacterium]